MKRLVTRAFPWIYHPLSAGKNEEFHMLLHPQAAAAIEAAACRKTWGRFATYRFLVRRAVPLRLYQLACVLQAEEEPCPA